MATTIKEIDARTLKSWIDRGECMLVDVREPGEHAREHIPGARLVPLDRLDPAALGPDSARRIVLHCASGARSMRGVRKLSEAGIDVAHLPGGIEDWKRAGFPVVENRKAPIPIMRQVQIVAGSLVLAGATLGTFVHPGFYALSGFVGAGLVFAGATGFCGMAALLGRLPYNRV
ncbi:MAG: rhodanese-like domain-containing protein [Rhodospirillales bacterium]|nr:rhodanese-like domain-containing protein [Rhodospirillales bacterium]